MKSTERFGNRADAYTAYRPGYPEEVITMLLSGLGDPQTVVVADVGAGTGISSRALAERGVHVIALEPNASMRAKAVRHERIEWRDGTAEATQLADASVDLIVAFQAFHWFATDAVMREFRRISRGRAALVQHERDENDTFTRAYGNIVRRFATDDTETLRMRALEVFGGFPDATVTRFESSFVQRLDCNALLGRTASSSYLPNEGQNARLLQHDIVALFDEYANDGAVSLKTRTIVLIANW